VGLLRQVGSIWLRLGPEAPLLRPTELTPTIAGSWFPAFDERSRLFLVVSPGCEICSSVLEDIRPVLDPRYQVTIVVAYSSVERATQYLGGFGLLDLEWVLDGDGSRIESLGIRETPFAVLTSADGTARSAAVVNSARQVESLFEGLDRAA